MMQPGFRAGLDDLAGVLRRIRASGSHVLELASYTGE
jgi:hypothetical protein